MERLGGRKKRGGERGKWGSGGEVVSYELAAGGMPGLCVWGGEEEEEAEEEGGGERGAH